MLVLCAILSIGLLILIHEAGHFFVARALRLRVEVFSLGFGPALFSFHGKQTIYRIALVPLGGYVRVAGMVPGEKRYDESELFLHRPAWQRFLFLFAGPLANWLFAVLLLTLLYSHGLRVTTGEPIVEEVKGQAAAAGLVIGDRILAVKDTNISSWKELHQALSSLSHNPIPLKILRHNTELTLSLVLDASRETGITPQRRLERYPFGQSISMAIRKTAQVTALMGNDLRQWLLGSPDTKLVGPVGVVTETVKAAQRDFLALFLILIQISLALAFMNLLPLPSLDGGRLIFVLIEVVRRRPVGARLEAVLHAFGLLVIFVLFIFVSLREILQLLAP